MIITNINSFNSSSFKASNKHKKKVYYLNAKNSVFEKEFYSNEFVKICMMPSQIDFIYENWTNSYVNAIIFIFKIKI